MLIPVFVGEDVWMLCVQHYRAILLIPDVYNQRHAKALFELLLYNLGFEAVILHQVRLMIVMSMVMIIRFLLPMCWAFGLSSCTR